MKQFRLLMMVCVLATGASAADLNWDSLVAQKELWPAQCNINRAIKFKQGGSIEAGQLVKVAGLEPTRVLVTSMDGRLRFAVKPEDTNVLQLATGSSAQLDPAQRALTYSAVLQRPDLWPYRVTLTSPVDLGGGHTLRPGEKTIVMGVDQGQLLVASERLNTSFTIEAPDSDLLPQARQFVQNKSSAPGRFLEELNGKLTDPLSGAPSPLDANAPLRYLAFYRGAGWCGPCREFSPSLMKFYQQAKPGHPEFDLIFLSDDKTPTELKNYAKEVGFSWHTVTSDRYKQLHVINPLFGTTIPQLVVTDRYGKVLIDSDKMERLVALQKFDALLKQNPTVR